MTPDTDGLPRVGRSSRYPGVRVEGEHSDIVADDQGDVHPLSGGMSVSPDSIENIPTGRRPRRLGRGAAGRNVDAIFKINGQELDGGDLSVRPDPKRPAAHAFVEPSRTMRVEGYEVALVRTRPSWSKVGP
jgi:hypothetical protein